MKTKIVICLSALLGVAAVVNRLELPTARVTVRVLDETEKSLRGANVKLGFRDRLTSKDIEVSGVTDGNGLFTGEGGCAPSGMGNEISKEGFYDGWAFIPKFSQVDQALNRWRPWNETYTTVLRAVQKPVPLCAKRLRKLDIPALDQRCGYDLEKGDWVAPWGSGEKADFVFQAKRDYEDYFTFVAEVTVSFSQPMDGIVPMTAPDVGRNSRFRWERSAPDAGYAPLHSIRFVGHDPKSGRAQERTFRDMDDRDHGYFFRVRTVQQNSQIIAANYGKIAGDIMIEPRNSSTCSVFLTYYFNPVSLDRNLEWDPKRNLLQGLSWKENPREP